MVAHLAFTRASQRLSTSPALKKLKGVVSVLCLVDSLSEMAAACNPKHGALMRKGFERFQGTPEALLGSKWEARLR